MGARNTFAFVGSRSAAATAAMEELVTAHGNTAVEECDVIVALGGDGFVLHCLHQYGHLNKAIYGMNRGTVGFLLNEYRLEGLHERIAAAQEEELRPLKMHAESVDGKVTEALAFNEVSILRCSSQSANVRIVVDGEERLDKLICDGALVATAAGSTAYNLSAHGPVLPIGSDMLALTPISPFRPRRWRGALLPSSAEIRLENLDPAKRPVIASADHTEIDNVAQLSVTTSDDIAVRMLFDPGHSLNDRILREQFSI